MRFKHIQEKCNKKLPFAKLEMKFISRFRGTEDRSANVNLGASSPIRNFFEKRALTSFIHFIQRK